MENWGMKKVRAENHFVICGWEFQWTSHCGPNFGPTGRAKKQPIAVIASLEEKPVDDKNLYFVKGEVNEPTLETGQYGERTGGHFAGR